MHEKSAILPCLAAALLAAGCSDIPPEDALAQGRRALEACEFEKAADMLEIASSAYGGDAGVMVDLGTAQLYARHNRRAERAFDAAVRLQEGSNDSSALEGRAETRRRRGNFDGAFKDYGAAMNKVGRKAHLLAGKAACEIARGNYGSAKALLDEARTVDPSETTAIYNYGVLHTKPGYADNTVAARSFAGFIGRTRPESFPEQRRQAVAWLEKLNRSRPAELYEKIDALMIAGNAAQTHALRIQKYSEAFKLDMSNPDAMARLIKALDESGDRRRSDSALASFRALFPNDRRFD